MRPDTDIEREEREASEALRRFPRLSNGLTPDAVKRSEAYQAAKTRWAHAFQALRQANAARLRRK